MWYAENAKHGMRFRAGDDPLRSGRFIGKLSIAAGGACRWRRLSNGGRWFLI
jgi:hypothetical protein